MKWLERTIWATLVLIFMGSSVVFFVFWKTTEETLARTEFSHIAQRTRLQQKLESGDIEVATSYNQQALSALWSLFLIQKEANPKFISEGKFNWVKAELEKTSVLD